MLVLMMIRRRDGLFGPEAAEVEEADAGLTVGGDGESLLGLGRVDGRDLADAVELDKCCAWGEGKKRREGRKLEEMSDLAG
jgi:hypothetical protein